MQFAADTIDLEVLGLFAHRIRGDLPKRQQQPVAPPMVESFDLVAHTQTIEIRLDAPATLPRTWFLSDDEVQLVQVQHDRLVLNWRELDRLDAEYPRYVELRERLTKLLDVLGESLTEATKTPVINMVEVTYVNPVEHANRSGGHADLAALVNRLRRRPREAFLQDAEDAQLQARWRIPGDELGREGPIGRLHLAASPGLKPPKNTPIYLLNLTGRVIPSGGYVDSAMQALDVAHKWVVLGFKDLTTSRMHRAWGLEGNPS